MFLSRANIFEDVETDDRHWKAAPHGMEATCHVTVTAPDPGWQRNPNDGTGYGARKDT